MKARIGQSPDLADATVLIIDMAKRLGSGAVHSSEGDKDWNTIAQQYNNIYVEENMHAEMEK